MTQRKWLWVLIIASIFMALSDIHDWRTARYWRNEYDQQNRAISEIVADKTDPDKVQIPAVITLAKTCIDPFGNETVPVAVIEFSVAAKQPLSKVMWANCPKGTFDVNVYIGRK